MKQLTAIAGVLVLSLAGCRCLEDDFCDTSSTTVCEEGRLTSAREEVKECGAYVFIPAEYETVCEEVCVQPASVRKELVPAVYETRHDTVIDKPGYWKECVIPAEYKDVTEEVVLASARREWRKVDCADVNLKPGEQLGDAYCLVEIPAVKECRTKKVLCKPESVKREWVPPVYKTVARQVLVCDAYEKEIPCPPKYENRTRQELVREARWEWRWGDECPTDEMMPPKASQPSPPPPFEVSDGQLTSFPRNSAAPSYENRNLDNQHLNDRNTNELPPSRNDTNIDAQNGNTNREDLNPRKD
jgi:hypothetical protein